MKDEKQMWRSQVRLPLPMIEWVRQQAANNFRSVNAELAEVIRAAMQRTTKN